MLHMQRRCAIEWSLFTSLVLPRTFSMAPIINLYLTLPSLLVRPTPFSTLQMNATLPSAFQQTALLHSGGASRRVGLLFFSTTTSLLKSISRRSIASMSPVLGPKKPWDWDSFFWPLARRTDSAGDRCQGFRRDQPFNIFIPCLSHPGI